MSETIKISQMEVIDTASGEMMFEVSIKKNHVWHTRSVSADQLKEWLDGEFELSELGTASKKDIEFFLQSANNLSDLDSEEDARLNLGLGSAATEDSDKFLQTENNLSDLDNAEDARLNLGLGSGATSDANDFMRKDSNLGDVESVPAARDSLGLGSAATRDASDFATAAQGARADGAIPAIEKGAPTGVATLNADGKLRAEQVPRLAISEPFVVSSEQEMLALDVQVGDVAIRTDSSETFILQQAPAGDINNWIQVLTPPDGVTSFNGRAGTVEPEAGDYSADQVSFGSASAKDELERLENEKVDKEAGKGLSANDFTDDDKQKLDGIEEEATKNRADSENADKVHTHAISDVTGLSERLSDIDTLRQDLANPAMGAAMVARGVVAVDSIADLLALPEGQQKEGLRYLVNEYHSGTGVGGGEFYWIETPNRSENLITHFNSQISGQYVRRLAGELNAHMAGAVGDGVADDTAALQRFINANGGELPVGYYRVTDTLRIGSDNRARFYGVGGTSESPRITSHTVISWDGEEGGVILDVSQNAFPTPVTGYSGVGLYVANIVLQGNDVAGIGLNSNGATNSSKFDSITATGCNLFGVLINRAWFASYSRITAQLCSGIGIAVGYNFEGSMGDTNAVNAINMTDFRAHRCGSSITENPRVGYEESTQPWGGCGIYLGPNFKSSTVINRMQVELCHGNAVVVETGPYAGDRGIRDSYIESNGGPYDYYIFGSGAGIGTVFIDNTYTERPRSVVEVYNESTQSNTRVLFSTNAVINKSGPSPVFSDNYSRETLTSGVSKRLYGGSRIDAKYDDAWYTPGGTARLLTPEAGLLPGPVRLEETSGIKEFDGYRFNLPGDLGLEAGWGGASLIVSLFVSQWTAGGVRQAVTKTYIVNLALQSAYSAPVLGDYDITVTELGTGATVGDNSLITDIAVTGVKISGSEAVLRATYNVTKPPYNSNPNNYGPRVSWSAVILTGSTRVSVRAL